MRHTRCTPIRIILQYIRIGEACSDMQSPDLVLDRDGMHEVDLDQPQQHTYISRRKDSGRSGMLMPLNSWHAPTPSNDGLGLLHAGRERRRRELLASSSESKLSHNNLQHKAAAQQRHAVVMTIWSFVATAAFAFGFVLPFKGTQSTLDFVTGFLVEKVSYSTPSCELSPSPGPRPPRHCAWALCVYAILCGVHIRGSDFPTLLPPTLRSSRRAYRWTTCSSF